MKFAITLALSMVFFNSAYAEYPTKSERQLLRKALDLRKARGTVLQASLQITEFHGIKMPNNATFIKKVNAIMKGLSEKELAEFKQEMALANDNLSFKPRSVEEAMKITTKFKIVIDKYFERLTPAEVNTAPAIRLSQKVKTAGS